MQFLQCLNKMRIKQSAAWWCSLKSSPCHQMVSRHYCCYCSSLTFLPWEPGRDKSERCNKVLVTKVSWEDSVLCLCHSLPRLSLASRGSPRDLGAREGSAPAAPHTARLMDAVEYFYGADLDNSVDSPLAFSFSLMFQTTHGVLTLH